MWFEAEWFRLFISVLPLVLLDVADLLRPRFAFGAGRGACLFLERHSNSGSESEDVSVCSSGADNLRAEARRI